MPIPSPAEIAQFVDQALQQEMDPDGTGAYDNAPGSDNAALISVLTQTAGRAYGYAADRKAASLIHSSSGADLDDLVRDVYQDERKGSDAAVTTVYLQRPPGPRPATSIPLGTQFGVPADGAQQAIEYQSTIEVDPGAGVSAVAVPVKCTQDGTIGNVALSAISKILDPLDDKTWALYVPTFGDPVLGAAAAADVVDGGANEETDDEVKARMLQRPAIPQPGLKSGIIKGTTDVPGIVSAFAVEVGDGTGVVYAAGPSYGLPFALQQQVAQSLENWRPFGVPVSVRAQNAVLVQVSGSIYMQKPVDQNYDRQALAANAVAAVLRYFSVERERADEYLLEAIAAAATRANTGTQKIVLATPGADVLRVADSSYGSVASLTRYYVTASSVLFQVFGPLTQ